MSQFESGPDKDLHAPPAVRGLLFLVLLALFGTGMWLLSEGFSQENVFLFALGIVASGLAFLIPLSLPSE